MSRGPGVSELTSGEGTMRPGAVHTHTHTHFFPGAEKRKKPADTLRLPPTVVSGSPECVAMGRRNLGSTSISHRLALWRPDDQERRC